MDEITSDLDFTEVDAEFAHDYAMTFGPNAESEWNTEQAEMDAYKMSEEGAESPYVWGWR